MGIPASKGERKSRATRIVALLAVFVVICGFLEDSRLECVSIASAPLLVEETNHHYETTGGNNCPSWFVLVATDVMKSHCSRSVTWRTLYPSLSSD